DAAPAGLVRAARAGRRGAVVGARGPPSVGGRSRCPAGASRAARAQRVRLRFRAAVRRRWSRHRARRDHSGRYVPGDLMHDSPSAVTAEERRVHRTSLIRGFAVCAVWLATWPLRPSGGEMRLTLDGVLALGGWWAMLPGRRPGGKV